MFSIFIHRNLVRDFQGKQENEFLFLFGKKKIEKKSCGVLLIYYLCTAIATIAQLVEHFIRNEKVPGSSPGRGSGKEIQLTFQIVESLFFLYKSLEIIIYSFYD